MTTESKDDIFALKELQATNLPWSASTANIREPLCVNTSLVNKL